MLGKLLKYELRSIIKQFSVVYLIIILSVIAMLNISSNWGSIFFAGFITTAIIMCFVYAIARFNKSLLSDEGYLMFTVPVKTSKIIGSKLIAITLMTLLTGILITIVSFLLAYFFNTSEEGIFDFLTKVNYAVVSTRGLVLLVFNSLINFITKYVFTVLLIYMSLSIGQMGRLKKYKNISATVIFFGASYIIEKILDIIFELISKGASEYSGVLGIFQSAKIDKNATIDSTIHLLNNTISLGNIANIILSIVLFFVTVYILDKHLNLD